MPNPSGAADSIAAIVAEMRADPNFTEWRRLKQWADRLAAIGSMPPDLEGARTAEGAGTAAKMSPLRVALMNAVEAFERSVERFPDQKDQATLRKQAAMIRHHILELQHPQQRDVRAPPKTADAGMEARLRDLVKEWRELPNAGTYGQCAIELESALSAAGVANREQHVP